MADQSRPPPPPPPPPQPPPPQYPPPVTGYPPPPPPYYATQSNTAYPYYNPNNYNHPSYSSSQRISLLRRFIAILIGIFIIFATISFIIWLVLRPRLPEFRVDTFNVSNFSVSSSQVSGDWDVRFAVRNPNKKMSIYYDRIDSFLYYKSAFISETSVAPFDQGTKNQTVVTASFASRGNYVDSWVANDVNGELKGGSVGFDLRVLAKVRFTNGVWRMRRRLLRVLCQKIKVKLNGGGGSSGTLLSGNWDCRVGM